jgi:hypothetical protein
VDQLEDVESQSEVGDLYEDKFQDDFDEISEREDKACLELQDLADENDIDVDLECEGRDTSADEEEEEAPARTPTSEVRPTAEPTREVGAGDEDATPTAPSEVEVLNYRSHQTEYGLEFFGEAVNNGEGDATNVVVILTLTDAAGGVVGTGSSGYVLGPGVLKPGGKAPFVIYVSDPPAEWANEELQVTAEAPGPYTFGKTYTELEVSGATVTPAEYGGLTIRGRVTNTGLEDASGVEVVFVGRDTDGNVLWVQSSSLGIDPLRPGIAGPFEIIASDLDEVPPAYDILAAGYPP